MTTPHPNPGVHRVTLPLRWSDFDRYGHLNNAQYVELAQEARFAWALDEFPRHGIDVPVFFVRHLDVDYLKPVMPSTENVVIVDTQVVEIGRTSMITRQEIKDSQGRVACVVETVQVTVDTSTAAPRAISKQELKVITSATEALSADEEK